MYMCHVIMLAVSGALTSALFVVNCLGKKVKVQEKKIPASSSQNRNSTPIAYETDPAVLEMERKQRAAESRERMRKKREKTSKMDPVVKSEEKKEVSTEKTKTVQKVPEAREDATQPANSDENIRTAQSAVVVIEPQPDTLQMIFDEEHPKKKFDEHTKSATTTTEEQLGDVRLVDNDPDCVLKASMVKKQAREVAKKKQIEEAMMRKMNLLEPPPSPDDTLKNVSSLQFESQMSVIQRKKRRQMKLSTELCTATSETAKCNDLVEPKSNELYARELGEKVGGA